MIDRKQFDDTFQYFDKEVLLKIIDIFEQELPGRLEKIRENIREKDYETLAFNAHSLKSAAGTFMAGEPRELAGKMEQLATQGTGQDLQDLFEKLKSAAEELLNELKEIRQGF
jgi:HPt (histidine-containing phosphotransfer) domain-containing protein